MHEEMLRAESAILLKFYKSSELIVPPVKYCIVTV